MKYVGIEYMERLEEVIKYYVGGLGIGKEKWLEVGISEVRRLCVDVKGYVKGGVKGYVKGGVKGDVKGDVYEGVLKERCDMDVEEYHKYIFGEEELKISLYSRYI